MYPHQQLTISQLKSLTAKTLITLSLLLLALWFYPYVSSSGIATTDRWWSKWSIATILTALLYLGYLCKRTHWSALPLLLSTVLSSVYQFSWKKDQLIRVFTFSFYGKKMHYFVPPGVQNFAHLSAENLCILLLIVSPLVAIKKHYLKFALTIFGYCGFLNALFILFRFFQGVDPYWRVGFIVSNASMDATIVALTYPFFIKDNPLTDIRHKSSILFYAIPLIAIIVAQKWVGIGTAIVMLLTLILRKNFIRYKYVKPMLYAIAPASILSLMAVTLLKFIDSTGRADVWIQAFHFWKENANPWLGFGSNSSFQLLRLVQKLNDSDPNLGVFGWMHNEWLQFLFEQGILGLGSAIILYVALLIKSFKSPECFAAIVALGFAATANWPLHQPFTALFCATLSIYVLRETQWYRHN